MTPPIVYMPQKVLLLPDSIAANIAYPEAQYDPMRIWSALEEVGLAGLTSSLDAGIQTQIGEGGTGLSGGQAQRILLARLAYHQAPFVLVDEGTSALDPETERLIQALLRKLTNQGRVVITIAHRHSVVEAADIVLRLEEGLLTSVDNKN
jgi:subfamily B ATP-binding cassette protein MsbA